MTVSARFKVQSYTTQGDWAVWDAEGTVGTMVCGAWKRFPSGRISTKNHSAASSYADRLNRGVYHYTPSK